MGTPNNHGLSNPTRIFLKCPERRPYLSLMVVRSRWMSPIVLALWFASMLLVGAGLLAKHAVALPAPPSLSTLKRTIGAIRRPASSGRWLAVHVLYAECACSQRIVTHLLSTDRPSDWAEMVLWAGTRPPPRALEERFDVRLVRTTDLGTMGIEAAPLLIVADPDDQILYAAGYTDRKQGPNIEDARILRDAKKRAIAASLPVLGCAVSDRLRAELRPLTIL